MAKLTLTGLYNYDSTLFANLTVPEGIDTTVLIPVILEECGEFELLYPNLDYMKLRIGVWAKKHERTFTKWLEALSIDYDPLYNFDRNEEYTDSEATNGTNSRSNTSSGTSSNSTSETHSITKANGGTTQNDVSAYDQATGFSPKDKRTDNFTDTDNGTSGVMDSGNTSGTFSENGSANEQRILTHTARLYGNIGVTTSQQMLEAELDVSRWNIYKQIADLFVDEFCIMIY